MVALLLQPVAAERDQPKQRVVVLAVDPDLIGQRRAHAAAAATAVTAVAAGGHDFLVAFVGDLGEVGIGAFQLALGGAFGGCRGTVAASPAGAGALCCPVACGCFAESSASAEPTRPKPRMAVMASDRSSMGVLPESFALSRAHHGPLVAPINAPRISMRRE